MAEVATLSAVIIPVVIGIGTHVINNTLDSIYAATAKAIKERLHPKPRQAITEEQSRQIAHAIFDLAAKAFQREQSDTPKPKDRTKGS